MNYWLFKTEPDAFGIDDLSTQKIASWEGVRNYQARNFLRQCAIGDQVFIYHSSCKNIGIAGVGKIVRAAYVDVTQFDSANCAFDADSTPENPRWSTVDVEFVKKFSDVIPLSILKAHPQLQELALVKKGSRLSVMPVAFDEFKIITKMA